MKWVTGLSLAALVALLAPPAEAAFPGKNGRIAYSFDSPNEYEASAVYTIEPDGTDKQPLTARELGSPHGISWSPDGAKVAYDNGCCVIATINGDGSGEQWIQFSGLDDLHPAWSPDGTRIAYQSNLDSGGTTPDIYTMNPDGTEDTRLTTDPAYDSSPAWSPDGTKIAFFSDRGPVGIWTMAPDGSDATFIGAGSRPDWSPDGSKLAVVRAAEIFVMNADGSNPVQLTNNAFTDRDPVWSPDGSKIVWTRGEWLYTMAADGSSPARVGTAEFGEESQTAPDWQPLPPRGYVRPQGATPIDLSLVPAYAECTTPNRVHGSPLAFGSCSPPTRSSTYLTVGTGTANGRPAQSIGRARISVQVGDPATAADEADVLLRVNVTDVRLASDLSDYTGDLLATPRLRITDKLNAPHPGGPGPGTVTDFDFPFPVPCTATSEDGIGATCATTTTADTLVPGAVPEGRRSVWGLQDFEVSDGGPQASPVDRVFLVPGVFVP